MRNPLILVGGTSRRPWVSIGIFVVAYVFVLALVIQPPSPGSLGSHGLAPQPAIAATLP